MEANELAPLDEFNTADAEIRQAMREAPFPATPSFGSTLPQRLHRRRVVRRRWFGASAMVAAGLALVAAFAGPLRPDVKQGGEDQSPRTGGGVASSVAVGDAPRDDLANSRILFADSPVERLDLFASQEAAFVAVLEQFELE